MRYALLLAAFVAISLSAGCQNVEKFYPSVDGVVKDVRVAIDMTIVRGFSGHTYTIVSFQDDRCIAFQGLSPQVIPLDKPVKIHYDSDKIVGVRVVTPDGANQREDADTRKGAPRISD